MAVTPTGIASLPLKHLRDQLSESSAFQAEVGAANAAAALAFIHYVASATTAPPLAVVDFGDRLSFARQARGSRNFPLQQGEVFLTLRFAITAGDTEAEAGLRFMNVVGAIVADLWGTAGRAGFLDLDQVVQESPPSRPPVKEAKSKGDFYQVTFVLGYEGGVVA